MDYSTNASYRACVETKIKKIGLPLDAESGGADALLVRSAQQGSEAAFLAIFEAHKSRVYSLCFRTTGNIAEAEGMTQEIFLQVFRRLPKFRGEVSLSTWLYRVAAAKILTSSRNGGVSESSPETGLALPAEASAFPAQATPGSAGVAA